ncbi:MAG: class I SAM-dependent methyltransferase, partial [Anaerolineae bacterium]|nr:class I SAM-dependent methyltransferase [Anaerolineae bacterium]
NEGALQGYTPQIAETIAFIRDGGSNLHPVERSYLGNLLPTVETAIHLQCASGRDTLSLLNEGVKRVVGVDISDVMIDNARQTSTALNAAAEWVRCDILDTPHELDGTADLVYTGRGALCWMQDLQGWARVIARLLKPGGYFSVFDDHPANWLFDAEKSTDTYVYSGLNYFETCISGMGWPSTYIGELEIPIEKQGRKYERLWTLSQIFQAVTQAGLSVIHFGEHPDPYWELFPHLQPELQGKIPLTFSLLARKV